MPSGVWFHFSCVFRPFRGVTLMAVCVCVVFNQLLYWGIRVRPKQLDNVFLAPRVCWRAGNPLSTACFGCAFKMYSSEPVFSVIYDRFQCTANRVIMYISCFMYLIYLIHGMVCIYGIYIYKFCKNIYVHHQKQWQTSQPWLVSQHLAAVQHFYFLHKVDLFTFSTSLHTIHNSQCNSDVRFPNCRKWNDSSTQLHWLCFSGHTPLVFVAQMFLGVNGRRDTLVSSESQRSPSQEPSVCVYVWVFSQLPRLPAFFFSVPTILFKNHAFSSV